jgi:hypothetical protein
MLNLNIVKELCEMWINKVYFCFYIKKERWKGLLPKERGRIGRSAAA